MSDEFNPEEVYQKALYPVPLEETRAAIQKHNGAVNSAYDEIKDKKAGSDHEAYEILAKAMIEYKKSMGKTGEDIHYETNEVEQLMEQLIHNRVFNRAEFRRKAGLGDLKPYLDQLLEMEKDKDVTGKPDYERKVTLRDLDGKQRIELAKYHAKMNPGKEYSEGDITELALPGRMENELKGDYNTALENMLKEESEKEE